MLKHFIKLIVIFLVAYLVFLTVDKVVAKDKETITTKPIVVKPEPAKDKPADNKKERKIPTLKKELRKEKK